MEVIVDELRKNNVTTLLLYISYILGVHEDLYKEMANRLYSDVLMNVNNFGRVMAYLALVYRMNIPKEDVTREAVRLVVPVLKDMNITKVEEESFIRRIFSSVGRVLYEWSIS